MSDLHVAHPQNRAWVESIPASPADWLILGGDVTEKVAELEWVLDTLGRRFAQLLWVPGNHELWTVPGEPELRGEAKYQRLIEACRARGVLTPEDPYPPWPGEGPPTVVAPLFLLYDYSFRPPEVTREGALAWAMEHEILCADEHLLHPDPHPSRDAWCEARVRATAARLDAIPEDTATVLVNHFPLRHSHAWLPRIPRFSLWCGTQKTDDWHVRYRARAVVYGHLHIPRGHVDDGVPFEEVSLGYPRQWSRWTPALRTVLPRNEARAGTNETEARRGP